MTTEPVAVSQLYDQLCHHPNYLYQPASTRNAIALVAKYPESRVKGRFDVAWMRRLWRAWFSVPSSPLLRREEEEEEVYERC
jgi:hypothetical protein